jgi:hypothetical protein
LPVPDGLGEAVWACASSLANSAFWWMSINRVLLFQKKRLEGIFVSHNLRH